MNIVKKIIAFIFGLFGWRSPAETQATEDAAAAAVEAAKAHEASVEEAAAVEAEIIKKQDEVKEHHDNQVQDAKDPFNTSDWNSGT